MPQCQPIQTDDHHLQTPGTCLKVPPPLPPIWREMQAARPIPPWGRTGPKVRAFTQTNNSKRSRRTASALQHGSNELSAPNFIGHPCAGYVGNRWTVSH